jgi:glycosyltransferase involved in cell wall biosynthesis
LKSKCKILYVIDSLAVGGKERRLVELLRSIAPTNRYSIELVVLSNVVSFPEIYRLPIRIHCLDRRWKKDPLVAIHLYRIAKNFSPHIIHIWESMSAVYALPVAKLVRAKFVNGMITDADPNIKPFTKSYVRSRLTFPFSDVIVANSAAGVKAYGAPPKKSRVIHNGFDPARIQFARSREAVRSELCIKTRFVVGMVGGIHWFKDHATFIAAAAQVLDGRSDVTFLVVGEGPYFSQVEALVPQQHKERILFTGKRPDVESIVNALDVGVLATFTEGISNVIMEYMAFAKPVVATDGGGTSELVQDGVTGFLVRQRDSDDMARRINELLDDPDSAERIGQAGKQRVLSEFHITSMAERFATLYEETVVSREQQN